MKRTIFALLVLTAAGCDRPAYDNGTPTVESPSRTTPPAGQPVPGPLGARRENQPVTPVQPTNPDELERTGPTDQDRVGRMDDEATGTLGRTARDRADMDRDEDTDDERAEADNTGINERDRDLDTLTPEDQSGTPADRNITQEIRKAVVASDGLSVNAKNVKIITVNGRVTLRGPVRTADEKAAIAAIAARFAQSENVDDQLEVAQR